jgi:hypothetical protein
MNAIDPEAVIPEGENAEAPETGVADNPAWSDFLGSLPESMHPMVKPHLAKWDEGVNSRIQKVHEEWAPFKPYRDAGIDPEILNQAYGIYQAIDTDPRKVYDLLGETYGYSVNPQVQPNSQGQPNSPQQQQQNNQNANDEYDLSGGQFNPELARYQQMTETMAQMLLQQEEAKQKAAEDAALESELKSAREKYGTFDETFVLGYVNAGAKLDDAVRAYQSMVNKILTDTNRPQAPTVISGQGSTGVPSSQINPSGMQNKDIRGLVANMMKASNQQG